jgi:2-methylcitrate dehydratase
MALVKKIGQVNGLWELLHENAMAPLAAANADLKILKSCIKNYLTEYHSQLPVELALQLHGEVAVGDIVSIKIHTYWFTFSEIGNEPEKWHPTTRETADHSLPFIVAAVLLDGRFSDEIFSELRLKDQRIHDLADKISVVEDLDFSRRAPDELPCKIEIVLKDRSVKYAQGKFPVGHWKRPMTDMRIEEKFTGLAQRTLPLVNTRRALDLLSQLESQSDFDGIYESMLVN